MNLAGGADIPNFVSFWQRLGVCARPDIIFSTVAINLLSLAMPIVILQLYDRIIPYEAEETLSVLVTALAVLIVMEMILRFCRQILMQRLGAQFDQRCTEDLINKILHSDVSAFESRRHSDYLDKLSAIENIKEAHFGQSVLALLDFPFVILFLVMIGFFTGWLVLAPLSLFLIFSLFTLWVSRSIYNQLIVRDEVFEHRHNFLLETLQGMQTLKPLAMESQMLRRYERLQGRAARCLYHLTYDNHLIQSATSTLSQFMMVAFVTSGAYFAVSGSLSIGALAAGSMLTGRLLQPASRVVNFWVQKQTIKVAEKKLLSILELKQERKPAHLASNEQVSKTASPEPINRTHLVRLDNVSYTPAGQSEAILKSLSLSVEENQFVSISGNNGSGKSTLVKLILGLLQPDKGSLFFGGVPINDLDLNYLRQQIAYVPQEGSLFNGTVLENLTGFRGGNDTKQALDLARQINIDYMVNRMANGLATQLDSTLIDNVPVGFRQRVALVRALVGDPSLILFDDADTGYDLNNATELIQFFNSIKKEKTILVFTSNEKLISLSDAHYQIVNGTLERIHKCNEIDKEESKTTHVYTNRRMKPNKSKIIGGKYRE